MHSETTFNATRQIYLVWSSILKANVCTVHLDNAYKQAKSLTNEFSREFSNIKFAGNVVWWPGSRIKHAHNSLRNSWTSK